MHLEDPLYSQYHLCQEMLETAEIISRFDKNRLDFPLPSKKFKGIFITGEGSSRLIPGKHIIEKNMQNGVPIPVYTEGATQAMEYDLSDMLVIGLSNSGQTKELIRLFDHLKREGNSYLVGITANENTLLEDRADFCHILNCGKEKAVAATKSVVEQTLVMEAIYEKLSGIKMVDTAALGPLFKKVLQQPIPATIIEKLKGASCLYFAGRNNGIAEELTLKTNEIVRRKSDYLEGTYCVHGIEEVMSNGEAVILLSPYPSEEPKYKEVLIDGVGVPVISIGQTTSLFENMLLPAGESFRNYLELAAGWNVMVELALADGINPDKPARARKIGNEYIKGN